jgi:hypothetical protein
VRTFPTVRIVVECQGRGVTAWAVVVNGEVYVTGLTQRQANKQRAWLEFCARPEARAAARERILGAADN